MLEILDNRKSVKFSNFQKRLIDEKPGIYVIRYLENESPKNFTRLTGTDKEGILCIGKSKNLRKRITQYNDINAKGLTKKYHSEGWNFRKYFRDNGNPDAIRLIIENIEVRWKALDSIKDADRLETDIIQDYVMMLQDKPPLNIRLKVL